MSVLAIVDGRLQGFVLRWLIAEANAWLNLEFYRPGLSLSAALEDMWQSKVRIKQTRCLGAAALRRSAPTKGVFVLRCAVRMRCLDLQDDAVWNR